MNAPVLYIKRGCPYCEAAMDYLDRDRIDYERVDVVSDREGMAKLREISGQTKTPTLVWHGRVLADFDVEQLPEFLQAVGA